MIYNILTFKRSNTNYSIDSEMDGDDMKANAYQVAIANTCSGPGVVLIICQNKQKQIIS